MTPYNWLMRLGGVLLALVGVLVVQTGVLSHLPLAGARPNLPFIVVAVIGLLRGSPVGLGIGLLMGFLSDLRGGVLVGMQTVLLGLVGLAGGWTATKVFRDNLLVPAAIIAILSAVYELLYIAVANAFGLGLPWDIGVLQVVVPTTVYNSLLTIPVYWCCLRLLGRVRQEAPTISFF